MFQNYKEKFRQGSKFIFVPSEEGARKGHRIVDYCRDQLEFPDCFYHYRSGGHVTALHRHLENRVFFRIDLKNFYYAISRNRVCATLHSIGFKKARTYGKWSCVRNPFPGPRYALPIGFVQSPILASAVLMRSPIMSAIRKAEAEGIFVSVFLDDIIGSGNEPLLLQQTYKALLDACTEANLQPNLNKLLAPAPEIKAFNCVLKQGVAEVTEERIREFFDGQPSEIAEDAFAAYCLRVSEKNITI